MLIPMVVEKTSQGERSFDIFSRLMQDRIILLNDVVEPHTAGIIVAQMLYLESTDSNKDILFYINSPGGHIRDGLAILDTMRFIKCDVSTVVLGSAASMGSLLASSGTKGKRFMLPHSTHLIHQPLGGAQGQASDIEIQAREIMRLKRQLTEIYMKNTGKSYKELERDMDRDNILTAEQSVAYGLADQIVENRV